MSLQTINIHRCTSLRVGEPRNLEKTNTVVTEVVITTENDTVLSINMFSERPLTDDQ